MRSRRLGPPQIQTHPILVAVVAFVSISCLLVPSMAVSQALNPNLPVANNGVNAIATVGDMVYIGGSFDRVGPATGSFVGVDLAGSPLLPYPKVVGTVNCLAPDAAGGWFIGGDFTAVDGQPRRNLAQVDASGHVTAWNPGALGEVYTLLLYSTTLYVGGNINTLGGQPRSRLGAVDAVTGVVSPWDPQPNGSVNAFAVRSSATIGSRLYVGGLFTSMAGQSRSYLAAFNPDDGSLATWSPILNGAVNAIAVQAPRFGTPTLYIGGGFLTVDAQPRSRLAAFNADTGVITAWNPGANNTIRALLSPNGGPIYVAGDFTAIGSGARHYLTALDQSTGIITGWAPEPDQRVESILIYNGLVYAAGWFDHIGGQTRRGVAALEASFGLATSWDPSPNLTCEAIGANDAGIFFGGGFTSIGGVTRRGLAAFQTPSGTIAPWNPDVSYLGVTGPVNDIRIQGGTLYLGGQFTAVGGQPRNALAAVDLATGAPTGWNPDAGTGFVSSLAISGSRIYAGGSLSTVSGQSRSQIAAFDLTSGALLPWAPVLTGHVSNDLRGVSDILPSGSTVYLAGDFTTANGQPRHGLAAVDTTALGSLLPWNPSTGTSPSPPWVNAIVIGGNRMMVGGSFDSMGGRPRGNLAILDLASGLATTLDPYTDWEVTALALEGTSLYVGGGFSTIGLESRVGVGVIDVRDASVLPWDINVNNSALAFALTPDGIYVGGAFINLGNRARSYFAGFSRVLTGVEVTESSSAPGAAPRLRIAPNPFREQTTVTFTTGAAGAAAIEVFDVAGRHVRTIQAGSTGAASFVWDGRTESGTPAGAGVYFVRARSGRVLRTAKVLRVN